MNSIKWLFIVLLFTACNKEEENKDDADLDQNNYSNGLLVLHEGLFQQNNSTLAWVDLSNDKVTSNLFLSKNDRLLGDTGNDMKRYGGKIYIVVNASSTIEIIDAKTFKSIKQIAMVYEGKAQQPRRIDFNKNKAYISSFDGYVNILDTTSLAITKRIKVGANPEGIATFENAIYVANSGGLNFPNVDSTVYKIDASSNTVVDSFHVGANPGSVQVDNNGNVYVVKRGNYTDDPAELIFINTSSGEVNNLGVSASGLTKKGNELFISYFNNETENVNVAHYDMSSQSILSNSLINGDEIQTLYGIHPLDDGGLICFDAMGYTNSGYLRFFNANGILTKSISVGLNPNTIIYYE